MSTKKTQSYLTNEIFLLERKEGRWQWCKSAMNFRDGKKSPLKYQNKILFTQKKAKPCRMLAHISQISLVAFPIFSLKSLPSPMVFSQDCILPAVCSPLIINHVELKRGHWREAELWPEYYCICTVILHNGYCPKTGKKDQERGRRCKQNKR